MTYYDFITERISEHPILFALFIVLFSVIVYLSSYLGRLISDLVNLYKEERGWVMEYFFEVVLCSFVAVLALAFFLLVFLFLLYGILEAIDSFKDELKEMIDKERTKQW